MVDNAGRIFVGSRGSVSQFDQSLTLIGTYPVTGGYNVYDVDLTSSGQVIACGASGNSGTSSRTCTMESLGVLGSTPYTMTCCDASICALGPLCDDDSPVTLTPGVAGGTWSSAAPGFTPATGVFDPSIAGQGSYTFTYTQPCGSESITVDVVYCPTLSVCIEPNGDLSVSNGTGPYNWDTGSMVTTCPLGSGAGCNFFTHAVSNLTWTSLGTGTTITPPPGTDTLRVRDPAFEFISWDISTLPPCGVLPTQLLHLSGESVDPEHNFLEWATALEVNNDYYSLQSSSDAIHWNLIGKVNAAGNTTTTTSYQFTDDHPHLPVNYYRLGQTDHNGTYRHLSSIAVHTDLSAQWTVDVYPIPAKDALFFNWLGDPGVNSPVFLTIRDAPGKEILKITYSPIRANEEHILDVSHLAPGVYHLRFTQDGRSVNRKVILF